VKYLTSRNPRLVVAVVLAASLGACGLPRSGPTKSEIYAGSVQKKGDAFVVQVDDRVTRATAVTPAFGFSDAFINAGKVGADTINPGDKLGLTVWENVDQGLLSSSPGATSLEEIQVDSSGFIFVPYAGRIKAAGNTTEAIRRIITERLNEQTPDPQVVVRRLAGDGATVSLTGKVGTQGILPIERPTRTLSAMLARAGGVTVEPEIAQVTVFRHGQKGKVWFQDIMNNPKYDIALRAGDRILVEGDARSFTALGATGGQDRVTFKSQSLSALEAIAQVGGLRTSTADPTGVFVFRNESAEIANAVLGRSDLVGDQRMIYVLDLTQPNGVFIARDFVIRDGDTVYVTEAPFVQWSKTLNAVMGTLSTANNLSYLTQAITN